MSITPHFHKRGSLEGQISEKDLVPNDEVLAVAPNWSAPEGTQFIVKDGVNIRTYRMIQGTWRYTAWT